MNPSSLPFDPALVPYTLQGLVTSEQFFFLSGLAGLLCALMIGLIWSRGL